MKKAIIYTLNCPITGDVKYIGKTKRNLDTRLGEHIKNISKPTLKNNWIKSLKSKGLSPDISILDEVSHSDWQFWEIYWIEQFKAWGFDLKNSTEGGNGGKTSYKKGIKHHFYGLSFDDKKRNNISKSLTGRIIKESSRKNVSNPVLQFDLSGNLIKEWSGVSKASREMEIKQANISQNCQNKRKTAGGYIWKYKDSNNTEIRKHKKLSDEDIAHIRKKYELGVKNQRELSEEFNVSTTYISRIINKKVR